LIETLKSARPGLDSRLRASLLNPRNLLRLVAGGVNDRADLGDALEEKIFHGATLADLYQRPALTSAFMRQIRTAVQRPTSQ